MNEQKMAMELISLLEDLPPNEFVEEYNRQKGTSLTVEQITWDGFPAYYESNAE